jgi:hypothetical protein
MPVPGHWLAGLGLGGWLVFACLATAGAAEPPAVPPDVARPLLGGAGFTVDQLPDGHFRRQAQALAPAARARLETRLQARPFPSHDLDSRHVDQNGMMFYRCQSPPPDVAAAAPAPSAAAGTRVSLPVTPFPNALKWHSKAGASRVIFVDFDGHVVTNTVWNGTGADASWDCKPYGTDADNTTYSDAEQVLMYNIWRRMAEDYMPFDVDVTTEQPVWSSTTGHCLITETTDKNGRQLPHYGYGGIEIGRAHV